MIKRYRAIYDVNYGIDLTMDMVWRFENNLGGQYAGSVYGDTEKARIIVELDSEEATLLKFKYPEASLTRIGV